MFGRSRRMRQGGDESTNLQSGRDITIHNGIAPEQMGAILRDALDANVPAMRAIAAEEVRQRLDDFANRFTEKTHDSPEALHATSDPDIQAAFISAGIGYARSGDEDLGEILIDLVRDRTQQSSRSLMALVLNDAVDITPKLTDGEIAILTIAWRLLRTTDTSLGDFERLKGLLAEFSNLIPHLPKGDASYLHLQALGCISINPLSSISLGEVFKRSYPGLFSIGYPKDSLPEELEAHQPRLAPLLIPSLHNPNNLQFAALTVDILRSRLKEHGLEDISETVESQFQGSLMSPEKIIEFVSELDPQMSDLDALWGSTALQSLTITAVGMAIAHANWRHLTGKSAPLSIWINEDS